LSLSIRRSVFDASMNRADPSLEMFRQFLVRHLNQVLGQRANDAGLRVHMQLLTNRRQAMRRRRDNEIIEGVLRGKLVKPLRDQMREFNRLEIMQIMPGR